MEKSANHVAAAFAALDHDAQVARLHVLAGRAVDAWDLDSPSLSLVKYRENAVFGVTAADGRRAVLRVHRPSYRSDLDLHSEIAWTRHLSSLGELGVAAPQSLPARDGAWVVHAGHDEVPGPRQCDLLEWVEGSPPGSLEAGIAADPAEVRAMYRTVGGIAARMHALADAWTRPEPFSRPSWDVDSLVGDAPTFGRFEELDVLDAAQLRVLVEARDRVRARLEGLGPARQLIHGDLVPDNILVDGEALHVIDFDDFGWSWVGFEMATSLFPLQVSGGFEAGLEGYLEGYREVRGFPAEELELLPEMLMARSLSYLGWPVGRPEMAAARDLAPMLAFLVTQQAEEYLATR